MKRSALADHLRYQLAPDAPACPENLYLKSKARRESSAAEMAQINLRRRADEFMDAGAVRECLDGLAVEVCQELAALPAEIVEAIRPLAGDEDAIRAELQQRIDAALHRLAARLTQ